MATKAKRSPSAPRHPEKKWGPFHGGVGVAVWLTMFHFRRVPSPSLSCDCRGLSVVSSFGYDVDFRPFETKKDV